MIGLSRKDLVMNALRRLFVGAAALALSPAFAQKVPPGPPIGGCGIVDPPVAPQIRLQTPPVRRTGAAGAGTGGSTGGRTIVTPGSPLPPFIACAGDIGAAVEGAAIAPSAIGIVPNLLGEGFHLTSLSLGSDCAATANGTPVPFLATTWSIDGSDLPLSLSQEPGSSSGNRIDDGSASFGWQGYVYTLAVPAGTPVPGPLSAVSDSRQVLLAAIAELAPGLDVSCFARRKTGSWSDLTALGIGDPRPAVPGGFSATGLQLSYLSTPSCALAPAADDELSLFADFRDAGGGWIGIGAWSLGKSSAYPGSLQDGFAGWSSDRYQFSISGGSGDGSPVPSSVLLPIARALDPTFSTDCVMQAVVLSPAELPALGFHAPSPPAGWTETIASLTGNVVGASCARSFDFRGTYQLFWSFDGPGGLVLTASAYRVVAADPGPRTDPVIGDGCISWSDDRGTSYFVSGYSASGGPDPDRTVLVAVAQSMDPGLTIP